MRATLDSSIIATPDSHIMRRIKENITIYSPVFAISAAGLCFDTRDQLSSIVVKADSWFPENVSRFIVIKASVIPVHEKPELISRWGFKPDLWNNLELGAAYQIINFDEKTRPTTHISYPHDRYEHKDRDKRIGFKFSRAALEAGVLTQAHDLSFISPQKFEDGFRPFGKTWDLRLVSDIKYDKTSDFVVFHGETLGNKTKRDVFIHKNTIDVHKGINGGAHIYIPNAVYRLHGVQKIDNWSPTGNPDYVALGNIMPIAEEIQIFILDMEKGVRKTEMKKEPYLTVRLLKDPVSNKEHRLKGTELELRSVIRDHFRNTSAIKAVRTGEVDLHLGNPVSFMFQGPTSG